MVRNYCIRLFVLFSFIILSNESIRICAKTIDFSSAIFYEPDISLQEAIDLAHNYSHSHASSTDKWWVFCAELRQSWLKKKETWNIQLTDLHGSICYLAISGTNITSKIMDKRDFAFDYFPAPENKFLAITNILRKIRDSGYNINQIYSARFAKENMCWILQDTNQTYIVKSRGDLSIMPSSMDGRIHNDTERIDNHISNKGMQGKDIEVNVCF